MSDNNAINIENSNISECATSCGDLNRCAKVSSQFVPLTEDFTVAPAVIPAGPVVLKLPVVLAETNITIPVEAIITLDKKVIEIKRIKKNVFLTQARLIPNSATAERPYSGILCVSGFVRKNIEYATETCNTPGTVNICGDIRHCTVEVPFDFTTRVYFAPNRVPIFEPNTTPYEVEFFTDKLKSCDTCADPVIGRNPCDQSFAFTEYFNEKPFVELVRADIAEVDIHKHPISSCKNPVDQSFTQLTEKIIINLTLKVLQKQQVRVTAL
ncbi:CsxC family protein [Clostridium cellulovorans]|uniref:DUF7852 domain-containing protein n=1 Tax=Clostridium cellulovorans (strain ATCC 35296 / DSM 3052 / OCM 3 / 743B) TaxID=573061 RepID=D9SLY5_CLOC7|nr:hypothetical protein [Clostridium cellulovorans]ADL51716.1 hypothetical protein Clocel_1972 [Clostridium cellulovorans 743B]